MQQLAAAAETAVEATDKNDVSTANTAVVLDDAVGATAKRNLGVGIKPISGKTQQPELESTLQSADPVLVTMSPLAQAALIQGTKKETKKNSSKQLAAAAETGVEATDKNDVSTANTTGVIEDAVGATRRRITWEWGLSQFLARLNNRNLKVRSNLLILLLLP
jgi:hypothetical protein